MGRKTGASRKFPDISMNDKMETKEYFNTPDSANDPWSNDNVAKNMERYKQSPLRYIEEISRKHKLY